jgi:putative phage-type endonuclease
MRKTSMKVRNLLKKPQYAQKTPEWFAQRKTRMTASEVANCLTYSEVACSEYMRQFPHVPLKLNGKSLNSYQTFEDHVMQKCGNTPFKDNVSTLHGKKLEDVACALYTRLVDKNVHEFGLINHSTLKWLAASPDGITDDGVMLEIKCPNKRKIKDNEVPLMYWIQMQIQMEVCNLDTCDYLECEIEECSLDDFLHYDIEHKGIIGKYTSYNESDTSSSVVYIYPPKHLHLKQDFLIWQDSVVVSLGNYVSFEYYVVTKYQLISIERSKVWFKNVKDILKNTHTQITKYQTNQVLFEEFKQEYMNKKNKRFMDKFNATLCTL